MDEAITLEITVAEAPVVVAAVLSPQAVNVAASAKFRAKMYDCQFGPRSIAGDATVGAITTARFERCSTVGSSDLGTRGECFGGCTSWGMAITSDAVFIDCDGGDRSFGLGFTNAGTFIRCRGGESSFSGTKSGLKDGIFTGYAEDCWSGPNSFGGTTIANNGKCSGTLVRCTWEGNTQSTLMEGATLRGCRTTVAATGVHAFTLIDSTSVISDSDIIVLQGGTGIPIYAATAQNAAVYGCRFNNAGNDADGLGANVTNLVATPGNVISDAIE